MILPWHNPLRVAENAAVLDLLSGGRLRLGFGRGLARREFATFGMNMDESRERFDEAAPMIVDALKTGFIEGDGKFYPQPRTEIRPRPQHSFDGRIYAVAASDESVPLCGQAGRAHHHVSPTVHGRCGCRASSADEPCTGNSMEPSRPR